MKLGYNIWQQSHYDNLDELIHKLKAKNITDVAIVYAVTIESIDTVGNIKDAGGFIPRDKIPEVIKRCYQAGLNIWLKVHIHPRDSKGCKPKWAQAYVGIDGIDKDIFKVYNQALQPLYMFELRDCISGLVLGTELECLADSPEWLTIIETLRESIPGTFQLHSFKITYAHSFYNPFIHEYNGVFATIKRWLGSKYILDKLDDMSSEFYLPDKYKDKFLKKVLKAKGKVNIHNELDFLGLDCYPYYTYDQNYSGIDIRRRLRNYTIYYKFWWWTIPFKLDYLDSIRGWSDNYILTECGIPYYVETCEDREFNTRWWGIIKEEYRHLNYIFIWDDLHWDKSIVIDCV